MGQSFHDSLTNMKMFVVLALAAMAMAEPEADPQVFLNQHVTSINNVPVVQTPLVNTVVSNPTVYSTAAHSVAPSVYHPNVYTPHVYLGKREAEAEPEADALYGYYGYARPYAYGYRSYGYPYSYGKRSADAEPEADAYYYGAYGYRAYTPYTYGGLYRPTYTTRWGGYGKRSADAEAEADPALVYNAVTPVHSVVSSPLVSALTPAATVKTVHTPVVSTLSHPVTYTVPTVSAVPAVKTVAAVPAVKTVATVPAVHTYAGVHAVHTPVVNTVGSTVYYGKREAEADPALLYTGVHTPVHSVYSSPLVHHAYTVPAVHTATVAKAVVPAVTVAKTADHGVVGTYAGLVHSSHAGICLNNVGVQVPC